MSSYRNRLWYRRTPRRLMVAALLAFITVGFWWKLVLTNQYSWLDSPDLVNQVIPWWQLQASSLHSGTFALWDPYLWMGQPLLGQGITGSATPTNWILTALPLRNGWLRQSYLHWYFVLLHLLAVWFAYALCRQLRASRFASAIGGLLFGCSGYMGTTDWPQMLNGAIWIPLVLLFLIRATGAESKPSDAIFSGTFYGLAWLSGHHQIPIFLGLAVAAFWLVAIVREPSNWKRYALYFSLWGTFAGLVAGLQLLPALEYGKLARRWVGLPDPVGWSDVVPYNIHSHYSLQLRALYGLIFPRMEVHANPFIGVAAVSLAALAIASRWRNKYVPLFAGLALGALFFALGGDTVFHGILYAVLPLIEKARSPSMAIVLTHIGIAGLAALGADSLKFNAAKPATRTLSLLLAGLATVVFTIVFGVLLVNPALLKNEAVLASALTAAIASAVFFGRSSGGLSWRFAMTLILAVVLWETAAVSTYGFANRFHEGSYSRLKSLQTNSDIVDFFRTRNSSPFRVEIYNNAIAFNFGDWYGVDTTGGYLASLTENINQQDTYSDRAIQLLNVRYSVRAAPNRAGQTEVYVARSGVKVFENPGVLPRAWAVHDVAAVHNLGEVQHFMQTRNPAKTAVMIGTPPPVDTCEGADSVTMWRPNVNAVDMRANMACRGMVVLSETFYPGWIATVDGATVPIYQVYGMLRGVPVNAGSHKIEMRYRPKSVLIGFGMTVLGLLAAAIVALRLHWPRRA
jgi:hypothetical protein